jgi:hypothetical protein
VVDLKQTKRRTRKMAKRCICMMIGIAILLLSPLLCFAETVDDLRKEVDELKNRVETLSAEQEDVVDKISNIIKITGYADLDYTMTDKPGEDNEFRIHKFALILKKEWTKEWNFFTEVEYEDGPFYEITTTTSGGNTVFKSDSKQEGKIFNEIFYLEHKPSSLLEFRFGRFLTPAGIWNQEPYSPFVPTDKRPEHIRKIFPQIADGLRLHGQWNIDSVSVVSQYFIYAANGSGEPGKGDSNENKAIGGRLSLKIPILTEFVIGASVYTDDGKDAEKRDSIGADIKLQIKDVGFWGEYAKAEFNPAAGSYDREGYYAQLMYDIGKFTTFYRYDYYEPKSTVTKDETTVDTIGLNYHFAPEIVAKLEHHWFNPEGSANYMQTILSMAVYFGE